MPAGVSTITQSGQVSIPKVIRDILGVGPGDQVEFLSDGERVQIVAVPKDADEDYAAGRVTEIRSATDAARTRYGL